MTTLKIKFGFIREFQIPDDIINNPNAVEEHINLDFEQAESNNEIIRYVIEDIEGNIKPEYKQELIDTEI